MSHTSLKSGAAESPGHLPKRTQRTKSMLTQVLHSRVSKQPQKAAQREKGKGLAALPGHCSSWELQGGKRTPWNNPLFECVTVKGSKHLKTQGSKLGKARTPQRGQGQSPGPQSLRSGLAQAFQILLAAEMCKTRGQALGITQREASAPRPPWFH